MSDLLAQLWKSIEKGWQAGAPGPSLGPSVGRGLFSNPFLTERDRDLRDVRTLYARVRDAYERSPFADEERLDQAMLSIFRSACRASKVENYAWALAIGYDAARGLLVNEFLAFPDLTEAGWSRLTLGT